MKKHTVKLTQEQRERLQQLTSTGQAPARRLTHARILLKADESEGGPGWSDAQIKQALEVGLTTIWRVRKRFHERGWDEALDRQPQPERPEKRIIDGEFAPAEARRLVERLEIHYTPKHASCLNMAEIELSVLTQHGLSHRVASPEQ